MKYFNFLSLILVGFLFAFSSLSVMAQDETLPDAPKQQANQPERPKLMEQLGLTREQIQEIRRINAEKRPLLREAQNRLREANRNLDQAIYADNANETDIQAQIKQVQFAQAEVIKIRSTTELAVRKILTAEQLVKFRDVRQQFMQKMNNRQNQRRNRRMDSQNRPADAPLRNFKNRSRLPRSNN